MLLMYIDESGAFNEANPFVLAGLIISPENVKNLERQLDQQISDLGFSDQVENIEIHGNPINKGSGFWRRFTQYERNDIILNALSSVKICSEKVLFTSKFGGIHAKEELYNLYDELLNKFNKLLKKHKYYGVCISDKSKFESFVQTSSRKKFSNIIETPMFLDSKQSRCLQSVDLLVYSHRRKIKDTSRRKP